MKKLLQSVSLLFLPVLFSGSAFAQTGWRWGASNIVANDPGNEVMAATTDDSANIIAVGLMLAPAAGATPYIIYGSDTVFTYGGTSTQLVVKCDSNGQFLWARGSRYAYTYPITTATDAAGNVYVFGVCKVDSNVAFDTFNVANPKYATYYLVKYSPGGSVLWAKGVVSNSKNGQIGGMGVDGAGYVYVSAQFSDDTGIIGGIPLLNTSPSGDTFDVFIAKYGPSGNTVWAKSFGGHMSDYSGPISVTPAGNIYIAGFFTSPTMIVGSAVLTNPIVSTYPKPMPYLTKFDNNGNLTWADTLNRNIYVTNLTHGTGEEIYMTGSFSSSVICAADTIVSASGTAGTGQNPFLIKYNPSGHPAWARSAKSMGGDGGLGIMSDKCGKIWICGHAMGNLNGWTYHYMVFENDTLDMPSDNYDPLFIAAYSDSGAYDTSFAISSGGDDPVFILSDKRRSFYIVGDYMVPLIFGADTLQDPFSESLFITKYTTYCPSATNPDDFLSNKTTETPFSIYLYPNPAADECLVHCSTAFPPNAVAYIYDLSGRCITTFTLNGTDIIFSLKNVSPGIYQCRIITGSQNVINLKLVVSR